MTTFVVDATASRVWVDASSLHVRLRDGREVSVPLDWFPVLRDAAGTDRENWRLIGKGEGIHWPTLDEDVSVAGLLRSV